LWTLGVEIHTGCSARPAPFQEAMRVNSPSTKRARTRWYLSTNITCITTSEKSQSRPHRSSSQERRKRHVSSKAVPRRTSLQGRLCQEGLARPKTYQGKHGARLDRGVGSAKMKGLGLSSGDIDPHLHRQCSAILGVNACMSNKQEVFARSLVKRTGKAPAFCICSKIC
jgi:hypothetical protein